MDLMEQSEAERRHQTAKRNIGCLGCTYELDHKLQYGVSCGLSLVKLYLIKTSVILAALAVSHQEMV